MKKMLFCLALAGCLLLAGAALALDGDYDFIPDTGVTYDPLSYNNYTVTVPGSYTIRPKAGKELGSNQKISIVPGPSVAQNAVFHFTLEGFGKSPSEPFKADMDATFFNYNGNGDKTELKLTLKNFFVETRKSSFVVRRLTQLTLDGTVNIKAADGDAAFAIYYISGEETSGSECILNLNGNASITGVSRTGFVVEKDLYVQGGGSLTVTGGTYDEGGAPAMIMQNGHNYEQTLTLAGGTLTLRGGDGSNQKALSVHGGCGLWSVGNVILNGGTLEATGGDGGKNSPGVGGDGIYMQRDINGKEVTLTVNGGTLRAKGGANGGNGLSPDLNRNGSGVTLNKANGTTTMTVNGGEVTLEGGGGQALYAGSYANGTWENCVPGMLTLGSNVKDGLLGTNAGSAQLLPAAGILAGYPVAANKYLRLPGTPIPGPDGNETQDLSDPVPLSAVATHADVYAAPGERAQIQVTVASGSGPFAYQWYKRTGPVAAWQKIPGATEPFYHTAPVTLQNDGYQYYCLVTDGGFPPARMQSGVITLHVTGGKASATALPATGDRQTPALLAGLAATSLLAATLLAKRRRR